MIGKTPVQQKHQPVGLSSTALVLLTAMLWGGTPVAISYTVDTMPPVAVAGFRFALAALFMLFWCRLEGSEIRLRQGQLRPCLIAGVLLFFQIALFNLGIAWSNSSHGSIFINTFVFWVVGIEHFVTRVDRLSLRKVLGLFVAAGGVLLILLTSKANLQPTETTALDQPSLIGDLILLLSAALLGVKIVVVKQGLKRVEPGKLIFWHDLFGVALFAGYSLALEEITWGDIGTAALLGLLYQGILVAGFCFAVQAMLLRKHTATQISVLSFTTPLFGIVLGVLFRGDQLSPWLFVAGACVAVGILLVNLSARQSRQ